MKEKVHDKKKMKTTEGRKLRNIYVCEREVALQLDNQLSWWQIILQQCRTVKKCCRTKKKAAVNKNEVHIFLLIFKMCISYMWKCVTRIGVKLIEIFIFTRINLKLSMSQINCTHEQTYLSWINPKEFIESNKPCWVDLCMCQCIE